MNKLFEDFFEDKKILLTGHTGFIGSWLAIILNECNAKVIGYSLPPITTKDNFVQTKLAERIESINGDIRNFGKLNEIFKKYKPEIIYHLAAQPIVINSYLYPKETFDINIGGTINIFESFKGSKTANVLINFTTDKVYENQELERGYIESDRLGGYDPYSSSKACSELITHSYRNSFYGANSNGNNKFISSVRCGNIIGGGDWQENRLIPDFMRTIKNEEDFIIRNPDSIRPWQFILEPLRGLLELTTKISSQNEIYSSAWNFGPNPDEQYKTSEIIEKLIRQLGKGKARFLEKPVLNYHETKNLTLDINKAKKYLDWEPILTIDKSIEYICDWYQEENITYDFDVNQINHYFGKIKSV